MIVKTDCQYFLGNIPCKFNKIDGRICDNCSDYIRIDRKILIVKLDAIGDVLRTTCILPAINEKYPNSHITWITKSDSISILNNKYINRVVCFEDNYLNYLLDEEFDIGICLDSGYRSASLLSSANCEEKYGFILDNFGKVVPANCEAEEWYLMGLFDEVKRKNRITYQEIIYNICRVNSQIYKPLFYLSDSVKKIGTEYKTNHELSKYKYLIGINTGGGSRWECKKWIKEYYPELIKRIYDFDKNIGVILFGGMKEFDLIKYIIENSPENIYDAECYDSIDKFAGVINIVNIFLTPDSLGFHLSVALNNYTMVLVGPTSPWELDVYGNGEIIYNSEIDCISCYDSICKRNKECMKSLTPELLFGKIIKRINETCYC
jgi:ADP-heptose:LPS heptosyltransferase